MVTSIITDINNHRVVVILVACETGTVPSLIMGMHWRVRTIECVDISN